MIRHATGERRPWRFATLWTLLLLVALVAGSAAHAAAEPPVTVTAAVEADEVAVGEPFILTIRVEGAQNVPVPAVEVDDFRADYLGPATQVSFVNGRMTATVTHRYRLIAHEEGEFRLGPFVVVDRDKRLETQPVTVRVRPAGSKPRARALGPGGEQALRLVIRPARSEVYVGERVEVTVTLYVGDVHVRDLQYPVIHADGVTVEKFGQGEQGSEVIDGRRYSTVRVRTHLTPVRAGTIPLRPTMTVFVLSRRGLDPFFGHLGDGRQIEVEGDPVDLIALPLPEEGRPPGFSGAVGNYDFTLTAQPTALQVGDPITLRMQITGTGNLAAVAPPVVPTGERFRRYDAQPVKGEDGDGRRVFEQVLIPRDTDITAIPAIDFSYFDPAARAYRTIRQGPIPIAVRAAPSGAHGVVEAQPMTPAATPAAPIGRDIVYIKDAPGALRAPQARSWTTPPFVIAFGAPLLAFVVVQAVVRRRERLAGDPRLVRFRAAGREAQRALAAAQALPADSPAASDAVITALQAYLAARLDLPPGAIERERVAARLAAAGIEDGLRDQVADFFARAERSRYAAMSGDRDALVALATRIVATLEKTRGLERLFVALLAVWLGAGALAGAAVADEPPQAAFFQGNQAYAAGQYDEAVRAYEAVRAAGAESGPLHFNLGNAYVKRGDLGRAIASYERAARLMPRDPDVAANLTFAREEARLEPPVPPLWQRVLAPGAFRATARELAVALAVVWLVFWGVLIARTLLPRRAAVLGRIAAVAGVIAFGIGLSLAVRVAYVETCAGAVIVAPGRTAARFEPSPGGTEHFTAAAGEPVDIAEQRDGWRLIVRGDGRRGWVPADAVERLRPACDD